MNDHFVLPHLHEISKGIAELVRSQHSSAQLTIPPPTSSEDRETRRSLDRIAYMGGLLLPFSIIAGLFSMAPDFGPGGKVSGVQNSSNLRLSPSFKIKSSPI
ncbi:hypothetical protein F5B20DRAFT_520896 [Whalleya microplaca]|nr:hypothetical protein F5B20DRAFT_520896 [Whalleya microplaca]